MATCPTCGNDVTQPGDVCTRCGASLGASGAAAADADSSGEFRILTAVFCDVVDSTALGRQLEPVVTRRPARSAIARQVLPSSSPKSSTLASSDAIVLPSTGTTMTGTATFVEILRDRLVRAACP
jgi:hypothetical protein